MGLLVLLLSSSLCELLAQFWLGGGAAFVTRVSVQRRCCAGRRGGAWYMERGCPVAATSYVIFLCCLRASHISTMRSE